MTPEKTDPETFYLCPVCLPRHPVFLRYDAPSDLSYCTCCGALVTSQFMYARFVVVRPYGS